MLFYRYISENITNYINALQRNAGYSDFDYAAFGDGIQSDLTIEQPL